MVEKDLKRNLGCLTPLYHPPLSLSMIPPTTILIIIFSIFGGLAGLIAIVSAVYHRLCCSRVDSWRQYTRDVRGVTIPELEEASFEGEMNRLHQVFNE